MRSIKHFGRRLKVFTALLIVATGSLILQSSSHREAPLISNDPLADNTDLYAFRSPDKPNTITILANYIPAELPYGGPNYNTFGENIRYEIHVDNNIATPYDDIIYRFTFKRVNEDPSTFFNIRLGKTNLKTTYTCQRSTNGGKTFTAIVTNGIVPPTNIGPRSIDGPVGLNAGSYESVMSNAVTTASTGEKVFCGPVDDPFYVDLGGIFDLGDAPRQSSTKRDGLGRYNVHTIALQIDIATLQKDHKSVAEAKNILDGDFVIGVWASASRKRISTISKYYKTENDDDGDDDDKSEKDNDYRSEKNDGYQSGKNYGDWVQVSRLGMPLTNEVVIALGKKDYWNRLTPYQDLYYLSTFGNYFYNPELALYMDDAKFGGAIPAFSPLRIQKNSLGSFGFGNGQNGLYGLKGNPALAGTALADNVFGKLLLPAPNSPRSVDLYPIFNTGVPNLSPYQLAVGKGGNPLAAGKPFINNFLPNGGDMLRLNMAVPPTPRNHPQFSSEGLLQTAVLGLTDPAYNGTKDIQWIPNMDGFPNGRRLEDDVTRIELQAVGGIVLSVLGLWYDDFNGSGSPVTPQLINVLQYNTGVNSNDAPFRSSFPYQAAPWRGTDVQP